MEQWQLRPANDLGLSTLERFRSPRREGGLVSSVLRYGWWSCVRSYLDICHRLRVHQPENLPTQAPFILVANHGSHFDALVLSSLISWRLRDQAFPLAAGDTFFESPWSSAFAATFLNALPVWRKKRGDRTFPALRRRLLEEECGYILFPEGTRSRNGQMLSFKSGIGVLAAGLAVPVIPCHLSGCFESLPPGSKLPRLKRIEVRVGAALNFGQTSNDRDGWREVSEKLEAAVRGLSESACCGKQTAV